MKNPEFEDVESCPHFLKEMKTCSLFKDGFYLPAKRNITTHCLTATYEKCPIYKRHYHIVRDIFRPGEQRHGSRRRDRRIPDQRKVILRSCDPQGNFSGDFFESVLTVDYSQGGMRIISNKKIPTNTLLAFNFDQDFLIPQLAGIADLCWQKNFEKLPQGVEAGLSFKGNHIEKAIALEIEKRNLKIDFPASVFSEKPN